MNDDRRLISWAVHLRRPSRVDAVLPYHSKKNVYRSVLSIFEARLPDSLLLNDLRRVVSGLFES